MYQSLYRKYRPKKFSEVCGQDVAKKILMNAILKKTVSHAYLFFGPRGTGKTSIAKMFARIVNCEHQVNGECCEKCNNCIESNQKNCVDIIEIDAASNNGVDEIRELKNKINLVPSKLKYKVYIIDEVHMLSTGAFNALLKTLEEPPAHIIFVLATTEFYKVPETIVSRCQTIEFKNIDNINMSNRLSEIAKLENIKIDNLAIDEIVKNSNGGMRDAIGLLDKISSYSTGTEIISSSEVRSVLGIVTNDEIKNLADLIIKNNIEEFLTKINEYSNYGKDLIKLVDELIYYFRNLVINEKKYEYINLLKELNNCHNNMKNSFNEKIALEIFFLEYFIKTNVRDEPLKKKDNDEKLNNKQDIRLINQNEEQKNTDNSEKIKTRINNSFVSASKKKLNYFKDKWNDLKKYTFDLKYGAVSCDLLDCMPVVCSDSNIILCVEYDSLCKKMNDDINLYEDFFREKFDLEIKIVTVTKTQWQELKIQYLNNIKTGYKYVYIDENEINKDKDNFVKKDVNLVEKAEMLFGNIVNKEE